MAREEGQRSTTTATRGRLDTLPRPLRDSGHVLARGRLAQDPVRELAPEAPRGRTKRVGVMEAARARVELSQLLIDGNHVLGPQVARVPLGRRSGGPHDPRARGDGYVRCSCDRPADPRGDAFTRFVGSQNLDLDPRVSVPIFERPATRKLLPRPARHLVARYGVRHERAQQGDVQPRGRADSVAPVDGAVAARESLVEDKRNREGTNGTNSFGS